MINLCYIYFTTYEIKYQIHGKYANTQKLKNR